MISFNLRCDNDHVFEAWFKDSQAFDAQAKKRQVECPVCGDRKVNKAVMAPNIAPSKGKASKTEKVPSPAEMRQALVKLREHVEATSENVGDRFPEEARKIHYGETEERGIYDNATDEEAKELSDEGVKVTKLPWIERTDS